MNKHIIALIIVMAGSIFISEIIFATAQSNSTNSDEQKITVTWLETNDTNTDSSPMISISREDFWKIFGPLLEQPTKR
jgi:hypothetical protein